MMQQELIVIVDFDHTLFDTDAFFQAAQSIAKHHGIPKAHFYRKFTEITDGHDDAPYNFTEHIKALSLKTNEQALLSDLSNLIMHSFRFLYPDAILFLKRLQRWNVRVFLITYADRDMRRCQIASSGVGKWIDHAYIVSTSRGEKISLIRDICLSSFKSLVIDDHPKILKLLEDIPTLPIRIRRKVYHRFRKIEPSLPGVPVFINLNSAYFFIEPILKTFGAKTTQ